MDLRVRQRELDRGAFRKRGQGVDALQRFFVTTVQEKRVGVSVEEAGVCDRVSVRCGEREHTACVIERTDQSAFEKSHADLCRCEHERLL